MARPIKATIHMSSLRRNAEKMKTIAGQRLLWAVVKADAYGHGLARAVKAFRAADGLAVIDLFDIERARHFGWDKRILLMHGFFKPEDLQIIQAYDAECVIHNQEGIKILQSLAPFRDLRVHIKLNSGMNRFGFKPQEEVAVRQTLQAIEGVSVMGVMTHFANACPHYELEHGVSVADQIKALGPIAERTQGACFANSAAALWLPQVKGDAVRIGISLYGVTPDPMVASRDIDIEPAMTLSSEVIAIQEVTPGQSVGYGSAFTATRPSRIAVIACGFADGYLRLTPAGSPVWINGVLAPIVGRIAMDVMTVDVTQVPEVMVGTPVELWGKHLRVDEVATAAGTIAAELLCSVTARVPKFEDEL